jgi:nitrogen regulatory protein P-II 2
MASVLLKLVTIIIEDELESKITAELTKLGAKGYTAGKVRGQGTHTLRTSEWEGENVRIEVLVSPETAEKIMTHLSEKYFSKYAVVAFVSTIEVLRGEKFV